MQPGAAKNVYTTSPHGPLTDTSESFARMAFSTFSYFFCGKVAAELSANMCKRVRICEKHHV
jgi:hypothetical protein